MINSKDGQTPSSLDHGLERIGQVMARQKRSGVSGPYHTNGEIGSI